MKLLVFIFILAFQACAQPKVDGIQDNRYDTYYDRFKADAQKENVNVNPYDIPIYTVDEIKSNNLNSNYYIGAQCSMYYKYITVNNKVWQKVTETCKEQIIYHELGHCLLLRDHKDDKITLNGELMPASLMISINLPCVYDSTYQNRDYYIHELFHPSN